MEFVDKISTFANWCILKQKVLIFSLKINIVVGNSGY